VQKNGVFSERKRKKRNLITHPPHFGDGGGESSGRTHWVIHKGKEEGNPKGECTFFNKKVSLCLEDLYKKRKKTLTELRNMRKGRDSKTFKPFMSYPGAALRKIHRKHEQYIQRVKKGPWAC